MRDAVRPAPAFHECLGHRCHTMRWLDLIWRSRWDGKVKLKLTRSAVGRGELSDEGPMPWCRVYRLNRKAGSIFEELAQEALGSARYGDPEYLDLSDRCIAGFSASQEAIGDGV